MHRRRQVVEPASGDRALFTDLIPTTTALVEEGHVPVPGSPNSLGLTVKRDRVQRQELVSDLVRVSL